MKLVLLAAGEGSRIKQISDIKPLTRLFGLTLLERAVKTAEKAGCSSIYLVTGYRHEEIKRFVQSKKLPVTIIYNPDWKKGNGYSLLAAEPFLKGESEFLIAMADHVSDGSHLKALIKEPLSNFDLLLAVDPKPAGYIDLDDATKVIYDKNTLKILRAGKEITDWNGIDTGFFKASPAIFEALRQTSPDGTLTAAVNWLAKKERARALPQEEGFWIDIDTREAYLAARNLLLKKLSKQTDGPVAKYINRKISIPLSSLLANTPLTPNQISLLSFLIASVAAFLFSLASRGATVAAAILTQLASIIDGCDGEIARLKSLETDFGKWFDAVLDRLADGLLLTGIAVGLLKSGTEPIVLLLSFSAAIIGSYLLSYTADKYDYLMQLNLIRSIRLGRDLRLFATFIAGLLDLLLPMLVFLANVSFIEVIRRVWLVHTFSRKKTS